MTRYYLKDKARQKTIGPYPTFKMADFMKGTYEAVLKLDLEVVEENE